MFVDESLVLYEKNAILYEKNAKLKKRLKSEFMRDKITVLHHFLMCGL
jgi:hypothetical protein